MTLLQLFDLIRRNIKLIVAVPLIAALAAGAFSYFVLPDTYTSTTSMYVLSRTGEANGAITNNELSASQMLTNDVAELIKSERVLSETASSLGEDDLKAYDIDVQCGTTTRLITLSVTGTSPEDAANVANTLIQETNTVAREVMDVQSVNIIDEAGVPTEASGPHRILYVLIAMIAGLFAAIAFVVFRDTLNTRVRTPEEVEELLDLPIVGRIPVIKE